MTVALEAGELMQWLEIAAAAGTIVTMLLAGLIIYWMVRLPRRPPIAPPRARDDERELVDLLGTMERRLALLERDVRDSRLPARTPRRRETAKEGEGQ